MGRSGPKEIIGIFPGQGSGHSGMLEGMTENPFVVKTFGLIEEATGISGLLSGANGKFVPSDISAQLQVYGLSISYLEAIKARHNLAMAAGHSLGFYSALCAAGAISVTDGARIIVEAQRAIEAASPEGAWAMSAIIGLKAEECETICRKYENAYVSNINSATQTVISGRKESVEALSAEALKKGALQVWDLGIAHPLHSPLMTGVRDILHPFIKSLEIREPAIPVIDHTSGKSIGKKDIIDVLSGQLSRKVLWRDAVLAMAGKGDFIEIGPSDVLSKLVRWIIRDASVSTAQEALLAR